MPNYRKFLSLTEEEIEFIIKDIFPTKKVDNIIKNSQFNIIECDIYIMEEYPEYPDTLTLDINEITTHDFLITEEECLKWKQFLLAKGCDERLKNNPYLENKEMTHDEDYEI